MGSPVGLAVKSLLSDMNIGDCIPCRYTATSGAAGTFSELGTSAATEIPTTGTATPDGLFYFIKVDKGILIADRVVQTGIRWEVLNTKGYIEGKLSNYAPLIAPTANESNGYKYTASSIYLDYLPYKGFTTGTWWIAATTAEKSWVKIELPYPEEFDFVSMLRTGTGNQYPISWNIEGSSDDLNWTRLDEQYGKSAGSIIEIYKFNNTSKFKFYRICDIVTGYGLTVYNGGGGIATISSIKFGSDKQKLRSLSGGNSYLGTDGKGSLTNKDLGAYPINNEWDRYIVKSSLNGKITPGDNNIWNWDLTSLMRCTPVVGIIIGNDGIAATNISRTTRGRLSFDNSVKGMQFCWSNSYDIRVGHFRPVLEYADDSKCTNIWY
jgi:hypothetical protein